MDANYWWIWMIVAAAFVIGEIFTAGFFLLWFAVGSAVAGLLAYLGFGMAGQLGAFVVLSLILFFASRPFAERFSKRQPPGIGADRFIGKEGIVLEAIDDALNTGRIRMDREEWRAESADGMPIAIGAGVVVTAVSGNHLVVRIKEEK
jgi:membrane protein implicated in regulation of membrane protease activity